MAVIWLAAVIEIPIKWEEGEGSTNLVTYFGEVWCVGCVSDGFGGRRSQHDRYGCRDKNQVACVQNAMSFEGGCGTRSFCPLVFRL